MVRIQRRSPLDTNLTKWLNKCECSLLYMFTNMMETELTMEENKNIERKDNEVVKKWKR